MHPPAFYCQGLPPHVELRSYVYEQIAPVLISLAMHYKEAGDNDLLATIGAILKLVPTMSIPEVIRHELKEVFDS